MTNVTRGLNGAHLNFRAIVRPAKAGMFSGEESHRGKSRNPVAWVASGEETKRRKPTDKTILGMVSESLGRNASEPRNGLDRKESEGRALYGRAKATGQGADRLKRPVPFGGVVGDSTVTRTC